MLVRAFPDFRMDVQDVIASSDKAVARVRVAGTHQGEFMGIPVSGKSAAVILIDITRFGDDGLAREHWESRPVGSDVSKHDISSQTGNEMSLRSFRMYLRKEVAMLKKEDFAVIKALVENGFIRKT